MTYLIDSLPFPVLLDSFAQEKAEKFRRLQPNSKKAEQVYLNTLTVYAVDFYLNNFGFEPDLANSDSWNPAMQTLVGTADLEVRNIGRIECIPTLEAAQMAHIPPAALDDRVAYVFVQFNEALTEATVLGFLETVEAEELLLDDLELRSLDEFPEYLQLLYSYDSVDDRVTVSSTQSSKVSINHSETNWQNSAVSQPSPQTPVHLSRWLKGEFDALWQAVKDVVDQPLHMEYKFQSTTEQRIERNRTLELENQENIKLIVNLTPKSSERVDVVIEVVPGRREVALPTNLELSLLSEAGEELLTYQSGDGDCSLQLDQVEWTVGDRFSTRVRLHNFEFIEHFTV